MNTICILIQGEEHVLNAVNTGKSLMSVMNEQVGLCPLYGKTIISKKVLGEGAQGQAMLVEIEGKEYVAKKSLVDVPVYSQVIPPEKAKDAFQLVVDAMKRRGTDISMETLKAFNKRYKKGSKVIIPTSAYEYKLCDTGDEVTYFDRFDGNGKTIIPPHSYLCSEESFSEYVIALYGSELARKGMQNFIVVFGFSSCPEKLTKKDEFEVNHYVIMQKIDLTFKEYFMNLYHTDLIRDDEITSIVIQLVFAIAIYQKEYKISHNDLHWINVFLERVKLDEKDKRRYFCYYYNGKKYCFPRGKYIVKIGDFGLSVKWGEPIVGNKTVLNTGYDQDGVEGAWIPNWYSPAYDLLFSLNYIKYILSTSKKENAMLNRILEYIVGDKGTDYYIYKSTKRPKIGRLDELSDKSAEKVLSETDIFDKLIVSDDFDEKYIRLGKIE